jgi:large subunit ribosomal protein L30
VEVSRLPSPKSEPVKAVPPKKEAVPKQDVKPAEAPKKGTMVAAIRIRGKTGIKEGIKATLDMLRLYRQNYCSIYKDTPELRGMLKKTKDYLTFGEVDDETIKLLADKRGEPFKGKNDRSITINGKKYKRYFRLSPPRKGFERGGIKKSFQNKGALGNRGSKINDLIKRMV